VRRFNYICKLLDLLITQKLTMLSGCAQKVLFNMLEEVAYQGLLTLYYRYFAVVLHGPPYCIVSIFTASHCTACTSILYVLSVHSVLHIVLHVHSHCTPCVSILYVLSVHSVLHIVLQVHSRCTPHACVLYCQCIQYFTLYCMYLPIVYTVSAFTASHCTAGAFTLYCMCLCTVLSVHSVLHIVLQVHSHCTPRACVLYCHCIPFSTSHYTAGASVLYC
jgi:hypothetical protein